MSDNTIETWLSTAPTFVQTWANQNTDAWTDGIRGALRAAFFDSPDVANWMIMNPPSTGMGLSEEEYRQIDSVSEGCPECDVDSRCVLLGSYTADAARARIMVAGSMRICSTSFACTDDLSVGGRLTAFGDLSVCGSLLVHGRCTVAGNLFVQGELHVGGALEVKGTIVHMQATKGALLSSVHAGDFFAKCRPEVSGEMTVNHRRLPRGKQGDKWVWKMEWCRRNGLVPSDSSMWAQAEVYWAKYGAPWAEHQR